MDTETIKNVSTIVSIVISILSLLGFGTVMTLFWKDKHERKKQELRENSELRENERKRELKEIIDNSLDEKLKPLRADMDLIKSDIEKLKRSSQCSNRCDLDDMYEKVITKGYASAEEKSKFESIYQAYHNLGKNGVMDKRHEQVLALPEKPARKTTKRRLNETKK